MNGNRDHQRRGFDQRGEGARAPFRPPADVSWVRKVIEEEDYPRLDKEAKDLADRLGDQASKSQIRLIFGTVKRLESLKGEGLRQGLAMLRPRLAYAAARVSKPEFNTLRDVLTAASKQVEEAPEQRLHRLVDLMEAILCYSRAASARKEDPS